MEMSVGEIKRSYKQAKNKVQQIGILADLNSCSHEEIEKIIAEEDERRIPVPEPVRIPVASPKLSEVMAMLYSTLEDIEAEIKTLEEEYRKVTIAIEVLGKVEEEHGGKETP